MALLKKNSESGSAVGKQVLSCDGGPRGLRPMRGIDRVGRTRGGELDGCVGGLGRRLAVLVPALAIRPVRGKGPVVSRRPAGLRRRHAIEATRLREWWPGVVSFWILSRFGPRRARFPEPLVKLRERRPRAVTAGCTWP